MGQRAVVAMTDDVALGAGARVHVGLDPAHTYRDALRRLERADLDECEALRRLIRLLASARPVERGLELEAWSASDPEHHVEVLARAIRWEAHVAVISVSVHDAATPSIRGAEWTQPALEQYARARGYAGEQVERAASELVVAIHWAIPVDTDVKPEQWRARPGPDRIGVSFLVQRVDRAGTPLVVAAEPHVVARRSRPKRR